VDATRVNPDPREAPDDPGRLGHDPKVGRKHEVDPGSDGMEPHGGDRRRQQLTHTDKPTEGETEAVEAVGVGRVAPVVSEHRPMGASAERVAVGPDHDCADRLVGIDPFAGAQEVAHHLGREGVAPVRAR
jgi:hypothetical protein